jgi:O-antigen/teichoic acid export membrane protein
MKIWLLNILFERLRSNRVILKFLSSTYLSLPVSIAVSFITLRKIDPYLMGVWSAMTIIETYANVLRLGVVNGMNRELPYYIGLGKIDEALTYARSTLGFSLMNSLVLLLIVPFVLFKFELNATYIACLIVTVARTTLSFYTTYLAGTFRTSDHFNKLSNIQFIGLTSKVFLIPLIIFFGFKGFLIMELFLSVINAILLHRFRPFHIKPELNRKVIILLMKTGVPLFITSYIVSAIETFPRLYIVYYSNEKMLGLYAPVYMIINAISLLPSTIGTYFYPRLTYLFGKNQDAKEIWRKMIKVYIYATLAILLIICIGYLLMDEVVQFFPKYADALPYMKLGLLVGPFVLSKLGNLIHIVMKKVQFMGIYVIMFAFFQGLSLFLLHKFLSDILLCAVMSQVFTSFCLFITSFILNQKVVNNHYLEQEKETIKFV